MQEEKLEEIQNIIEMKVTHRRNINKRRAKWGFESNSTIGMDLGAANVIAPDAEMEEAIRQDKVYGPPVASGGSGKGPSGTGGSGASGSGHGPTKGTVKGGGKGVPTTGSRALGNAP